MITPTADQMLSQALTTLRRETGLTATGVDSVAALLLQPVMQHAEELWFEISTQEQRLRLSTATGSDLDAIGEILGLPRTQSVTGTTSMTGMRFYRASVSLTDTIIPQGTLVWPVTDPNRFFVTKSNLTIPAGSLEGYVGISAPYAGDYYMAAAGELTAHNATATVSCTNIESISGSGGEDDTSYRHRLLYARSARTGATAEGMYARLLEFPGVLDARILPMRYGPGTVDIIVYTTEPEVSASTLTAIESFVRGELASYGIGVRVLAPTTKRVSLAWRVAFTPETTNDAKIVLRQQATQAIIQRLNTMDIGETLYMDRIEALILSLDQRIIDVAVVSMSVNGAVRVPDTLTATDIERIIAGTIEVV